MTRPNDSGAGARPGYETTDVDPRPLTLFLAGLIVLIVVSLAVSSWLEDAFAPDLEVADPHPMQDTRHVPHGPLLQATSGDEARVTMREERERLGSYGWIDRSNGVIHVPIDVAIDQILERGLPVRGRGDRSEERAEDGR